MCKRLLVAFGVVAPAALAVALLPGCSSSNSSSSGVQRLDGGGATFVQPIMELWAYEFNKARGVEIDYTAKGSGYGIQQMTKRTLHFGCSDAPMKKAQLEEARSAGGEVIHIPLILGPVVLAYNLPGVDKTLTLDGKSVAAIYMGKIRKWNDPALKALNPDIDLPDLTVSPVYRAEASGTTNIFKEFLAKSSPEFRSAVGASTEPSWPTGVGTGEPGNAGVIGRVKSSAGTIGYVEITYARKSSVPYALVRNRAGKPVAASTASVTAAAAHAMTEKQTAEPYSLHELTFSLTDAAGDDSYPITGMSYCVFYRKQKPGVGQALKEFLQWVTHEGQGPDFAQKLDYAPLPPELVQKIEARLSQIELVE